MSLTLASRKHGGRHRRRPVAPLSLGWALALEAVVASPAMAQQVPAVPQPSLNDTPNGTAAPTGGDVVVTGSRIRSPDAVSVSPITTIGGGEIVQRGATRVEDLINTLPQAYADQGGGNRGGTIGASGTATVNLRNLGNQRTLVLIDGRRLMQGDPARSAAQAADINNVPAALVERIDVVTGGASAVYGSDAIAGVVNFVLKKDFTGVQLDAQTGLFTHGNQNPIAAVATAAGQPVVAGDNADGGQQSLSLTLGKNFGDGRGNVTAFVGYRAISGVGTGDRDFSTCNLAASAAGYSCSLSSTTFPAQLQLTNPATGAVRGSYTLDATTGNSLRTYRSSDGFGNGPYYDLQAPDKRVNIDVFAHYKFSDAAEAYGSLMVMRDRADIRISPTGVFTVAESVNCGNPYLSAQELSLICTSVGLTPAQSATVNVSFRDAPAGSRHDYTNHTAYEGVLGLRGDVAPRLHYDVYAQYGRTNYHSTTINELSLARFANALRAVNVNGQIVCQSVVSGTDPSCVPINLFAVGGITSAARAYVENIVHRTGYTQEFIASGSVSGDLGFSSPLAAHPIGVAAGAEYRDEKLNFQPDGYYSSRDVAGDSGGEYPTAGSYNVKEVFGELRVPLVEDKPLFYRLSAEGGIRYAHYSTAGDATAYKAGAEWSPIADIRLRGSFDRAVRAPNLTELFGPQRTTTASISDPCEGATPRATIAQCAASGVSATAYGNIAPAAGQQSGARVGGNPNLLPEIAYTKSFGGALTPRFLRGVTVGVDYFDIKVNRLITTVPAQITLNNCIASGQSCDLIVRNPATGTLVTSGYVVSTYVNAGYLQTTGIDITATASQELGARFGRLDLNFGGTRTNKYETQILPGAPTYRCDGYFGVTCGQPVPHWRHRLLVNWTVPSGGFSLGGTWRYIGPTTNDKASSAPYLTGVYFPIDARLGATSYFDLATAISLGKRFTLRGGVNNLLDRDPPLTASAASTGQTSNGAFFAGMYDALGRYLFAGVTARF